MTTTAMTAPAAMAAATVTSRFRGPSKRQNNQAGDHYSCGLQSVAHFSA
jgi:hypothetical protein